MADICISYAREDTAQVEALRDILARSFTVWWDHDIVAGDYRRQIEAELVRAHCVLPVWSAASRDSDHVPDELEVARSAGVPLLPVRLEPVAPPLGFGRLQTMDLVGWTGDPQDERIETLLARLRKLLGVDGVQRRERISFGNKEVASPCFVFSTSSHETQIFPLSAVQTLSIWPSAAVLVSAYDIDTLGDSQGLKANMLACLDSGSAVLLDSGNYEAYRKADTTWSPDRLHRVLESAPHDAAFCFDNTNPAGDWQEIVGDVLYAVERDAKYTASPIIPIIHAPRTRAGSVSIGDLPELMAAVAGELRPDLIAVPERELGEGLTQRARTVHTIRMALNDLGFYQPLHLLGTGNPLSVAVLAAAGADCFDGLEWCRTVADYQTGALYHFQHYDFVSWQSMTSSSPLAQEVAMDPRVPFAGKVAFHNLDFFDSWMRDLRQAVWTGRVDRFLTARIPGGDKTMEQLTAAVPAVF